MGLKLLAAVFALLTLIASSGGADARRIHGASQAATVVSSASANTISATWTTTTAQNTTGACGTVFGIYNINAVDNGTQVGVTSHSFIVAGLTPSTVYFCQATAGTATLFSIATTALPATTSIASLTIGTPSEPISNQIGADTFHNCISSDNITYLTSDDTHAWGNGGSANMMVGKISNESTMAGANVNQLSNYGAFSTADGTDGPGATARSNKVSGLYCLGGNLYGFVERQCRDSTCTTAALYPQGAASVIKSPDHGATWANFQAPTTYTANGTEPSPLGSLFFNADATFGGASFIEYGADDGTLGYRVDDADAYVYSVSNDGFWNNGNSYYLARVPRAKLANLSPGDWQFWTGGDGNQATNWSTTFGSAAALLTNSGKAGMPAVHYIPSLNRYLMFTWYYPTPTTTSSTVWNTYESPHPWGPWTLIDTTNWTTQGFYNPSAFMRSALTANESGSPLTLMFAGDYSTCCGSGGFYHFFNAAVTLNSPACTLSQPTLASTSYTESAAANSAVSVIGGASLTGCSGTVNIALSGANASQFALSSPTMPSTLTCPTGATCNAGAGPQAIILTASNSSATNSPQAASFSMAGTSGPTFASVTMSNLTFKNGSGASTPVGHVAVTMSDGSPFLGSVASSDSHFTLSGCPLFCLVQLTGTTSSGTFTPTMTVTQAGVPTVTPSFTIVGNANVAIAAFEPSTGGNNFQYIPATTPSIVYSGNMLHSLGTNVEGTVWMTDGSQFTGSVAITGANSASFTGATGGSGGLGSASAERNTYSGVVGGPATLNINMVITSTNAGVINSPLTIPYTLTTLAPDTPDAPLSSTLFTSAIKFFSSSINSVGPGNCANVAVVPGLPQPTEAPFTVMGFFRPEDQVTFGHVGGAFGNQSNRAQQLNQLGSLYDAADSNTGHQGINVWAWGGGNIGQFSGPAGEFPNAMSSGDGFTLGQWQFISTTVLNKSVVSLFTEGMYGMSYFESANIGTTWPYGSGLGTSFAGYAESIPFPFPAAGGDAGASNHSLNGSLRDYVVLNDVIPTKAQLESVRSGTDPRTIGPWIGHIWGYYRFDGSVDPAVSPFQEPNQCSPACTSSFGGPANYYEMNGTAPGHRLPLRWTPSIPDIPIATQSPQCSP